MRVQNIDYTLQLSAFPGIWNHKSAKIRKPDSETYSAITYFQPFSLLVADSIIGIKQGVAVVFLVVPNVQHVLVKPGVACASKQ